MSEFRKTRAGADRYGNTVVIPDSPNLTESFTPEQRIEVNRILAEILPDIELRFDAQYKADMICRKINDCSRRVKAMDSRPDQVWSEEQPNVYFRYVAQGMLEDFIELAKARQKALDDLISELEARV